MRNFARRPAVTVIVAVGVAVAVGASTFGVAAASAEPPLGDVAPAPADLGTGLISDGGRVAYMSAPGHVRVIDEHLDEIASVAEPGCLWRSFGGGALLWNCQPAPAYPFGYSAIDDLGAKPRIVLGSPRLAPGGHGETPTWSAVGLRWMTVDFGGQWHAYVNRATAKVVEANVELTRAFKHSRLVSDVDRDDLTRAVCAPLLPKTVPGLRGDSVVAPLAYRPPYGATLSGSRLLMGRCGARRLTVLSRCRRACSDPVVGDRFVAWTEGTSQTRQTVYVRLADRGRTWRWQIQPAPQFNRLVAAIGRRLFVLTDGMLKTVWLPAAVKR